MHWIYIICFALLGTGFCSLLGVRPRDFSDAIFRSRKIMEIIEGTDYQDGRLLYRSLYKYEVTDNVIDGNGNARVIGSHKKTGLISGTLKKRLLDNGISHKELAEFNPKEET